MQRLAGQPPAVLDSLGVACAVKRRGFPFLIGLFGQLALKLVELKTTGAMDVTDAQSFFRAFPPTLPGVPPCAGSATGGAHGGT